MVEKMLGFGCMRLPKIDGEIDYEQFKKMVDYYIENGFNYFDTAHGYHSGKSEIAIRECIVKRYPREKYILTNKLTDSYFKTKEDIRPFFEKQLEWTGVDYFDYYLMHAQDRNSYPHFQKTDAYKVALELKKEGKFKHFGISFHDTAEMLEEILNKYPEIEVVQIQFNYIDFKSPSVQSEKIYNVCRKYNKPVIVMEPVRGGKLVNLPEEAKKVFDGLNQNYSYASYAIRFAASFDGIFKVLSGMSNYEQLKDNVDYMNNFKKLTSKEFDAIEKVTKILNKTCEIPCTSCRYCVEGCPKNIPIPDLFSCYNSKAQFEDWNSDYYYEIYTNNKGKASDCLKCGKCEKICPQHLPIRKYLEDVSKKFE